MGMVMEGCQGKKEITIEEKTCPQCGHPVEIFSVDVSVKCEHCGFEIYNDTLNCVQWCQYARKCVGDKVYEDLMKVAKAQEERRRKARMDEGIKLG